MSDAASVRLAGRIPVGRQPPAIVISPSKSQPWYGGWADGATFSGHQLLALEARGADPDACERITVYREATMRELWWPPAQRPPVFAFDCPVRGHLPNGRIQVIAPDGSNQTVRSDHFVGLNDRPRRQWIRA